MLHTSPERLHTISCGLAVLLEIFERFDAQILHVCENGVREGFLIERMLGGGSARVEGRSAAKKPATAEAAKKSVAKKAPAAKKPVTR